MNINKISEYLSEDIDYLITKKTKLEGLYAIENDQLDTFYINGNILNLISQKGMKIKLDLNKFVTYKQGEKLVICSYDVYILIHPISKKYPNLRAEIERYNLSYRLIDTVIEGGKVHIQDVLMGNEEIDLKTAMRLRKLFPNKTMEYLFK